MDTWTRWPHARIDSAESIVTETLNAEGRVESSESAPGLLLHPVRLEGVTYSLAPHEAMWRTFSQVVRPDTPRVRLSRDPPLSVREHTNAPLLQEFVRRYGLPFFSRPVIEPFTDGMVRLVAELRDLALYWDQPEQSGDLSRRIPEAAVPSSARHAWHSANGWLAMEQPDSLIRLMTETALRHIQQEMPMRRCQACNFWIAATRSDRMFCDGACRQANAVGRKIRGRRKILEKKILEEE